MVFEKGISAIVLLVLLDSPEQFSMPNFGVLFPFVLAFVPKL